MKDFHQANRFTTQEDEAYCLLSLAYLSLFPFSGLTSGGFPSAGKGESDYPVAISSGKVLLDDIVGKISPAAWTTSSGAETFDFQNNALSYIFQYGILTGKVDCDDSEKSSIINCDGECEDVNNRHWNMSHQSNNVNIWWNM
ncbi:14048_t:CDS:2 [Funneliformis mosseae]|uniref:14048_t:CDS:1 n=1 Tax=Funneliformis mosseae TaxID=27381 RepID=A0A9N9GE89_FUNMO|nr:14048_t:CDS:2 [Funneliformis mosseae]